MSRVLCMVASTVLASWACGCGEASVSAPSGLDEPVRVRTTTPSGTTIAAQFVSGAFPTGTAEGPELASLETNQNKIFQGELGKTLGGAVSKKATAVALHLEGLGSGYWVAPTQIKNTEIADTLTWSVLLDFGRNVPAGLYPVTVSAVDEQERVGLPKQTTFQMQPSVPQTGLVVSLSWDLNADLDLHVVDPSGAEISPKKPTSAVDPNIITSASTIPPEAGRLDRDSNANCTIDSTRLENIQWVAPPPGEYRVYVDMFSPCAQSAATFTVNLYSAGQLSNSWSGRLLSIDADNGKGPFLLVSTFTISG